MPARLRVECYAGYKADERPLRFSFVPSGSGRPELSAGCAQGEIRIRNYEVAEILDRWYGEGYECFKVRADDRNLYILRHQLGEDTWELDAFRADRSSSH